MPAAAVNAHGVYASPEVIQIDLPKKARYRFAVEVAQGLDHLWRWGYSYTCTSPVAGGGGHPQEKGEAYSTRTAAIIAAAEWLLEKQAKRGKCQKSIDALEIFLGEMRDIPIGDCGHNRPECPADGGTCPDCLDPACPPDRAFVAAPKVKTIPDHRRLRKAYLIARDIYWIWKGHYSHDPSLSAWGMTEVFEDAYRFSTLDEAIDYWRSRHSFPQDYEHTVWDGYLRFYEETSKGLRRVMPTPPQGELF